MADKDIKIGIKTTADTQGAKATTSALRETTAAATQLDGSASALNTQLTATGNTAESVGFKMSGKLQGKFQQVGYQVQDFATQVAMGTSAVTAFGQQAPQLLGAFGPAGAVAGAFISLGALAYGVFSKMGGNVQSATDKLEAMKEAVDEIAKNKGLELEDEFADSARAIDDAVSSAAALKQEFLETKKAVNELALAQLELSAENAKAARLDMEVKGRPESMKPADWEDAMSPLRALEERATAAAEKAREVARQALVTDQDRLKAAQDMAAEAGKMLEAREQEKKKAQGLLEVERETLSTLRLQKEAKEKVVKVGTSDIRMPAGSDPDEFYRKRDAREKEVKTAKSDLSGGSPFTAQLKIAESRIATLEKSLTDNASKLNTDITGAKTALDAANTKLTDTTSAVEVGAETINAELTRKTTVEIVSLKKAGLETGKTVTDAAKDAIKAVEDEAAKQGRDMNLPEQEAVGRIQKLIADTVPDSAQGGQLQSLIQGLANNITAKDSALAGGLDRLISLVGRQTTQYTVLLGKIADLEAKQKQVK